MVKKTKGGSRRQFSEEFKKGCVRDYERGIVTARELSRSYHVSVSSVYKWINKYSYFESNNLVVVELKHSKSYMEKELKKRIKELEALLGQKQVKIEYLEKIIEVADRDMDIDLKKYIGTKP